jgi:hypothetical protein
VAGRGSLMCISKYSALVIRDLVTVLSDLNLYSPAVTVLAARLNTQQFYVLPTQCVYVFCVDLRTNSDYFPIQH